MILEYIKTNDFKEAYNLLTAKDNVDDYAKEYENDRKIRDTQIGKVVDRKKESKTDRKFNVIPIPFQREIVSSAATFLFGNKPKFKAETSEKESINNAFQAFLELWKDLRLWPLFLKFAMSVKSETEAAIVLFPVDITGGNLITRLLRFLKIKTSVILKARLLDHKQGKLYPYFDQYGDMEAFGWEYTQKIDNKDKKHLYLFTAEKTYLLIEDGSAWIPYDGFPQENKFGKIPVVYMSQEYPEWNYVAPLIDRFENTVSKFCDTNDYFADPKYKATGKIKQSIEDAKVIELDIVETKDGKIVNGDIDIISWDRAPESVKLELETVQDLIYNLSGTTNFSFESMKGVGNVANYAMTLMFFKSILKAKRDQPDYEISIYRMANIVKAGLGNIIHPKMKNDLDELQLDVEFSSILPKNIKEIIEFLTEATAGNPIMSQKTAMKHNPLVDDVEAEEEQLSQESKMNLGDSVE